MEHPLRTFRKRADLTLDQLAELTGISKASLSRIETADQKPSFDVIRKLTEFSRTREGINPLSADDFIGYPPANSEPEGAAA